MNVATKDDQVQEVKISRNVQHPDYNESNYVNDIAILQLERDVQFTGKVFI